MLGFGRGQVPVTAIQKGMWGMYKMRCLTAVVSVLFCGVSVAIDPLPLKVFETLPSEFQEQVLEGIRQSPLEDILRICGGPKPAAAAGEPAVTAEGTLRIMGLYPVPGMQIGEEIVIFFDEDLAPLPDVEGVAPVPVTVDPNVDGHALLEGNRLRFSSAYLGALVQNSAVKEIKVLLHPGLRSVSGKPLRMEDRVLTFSNEMLAVEKIAVVQGTQDAMELSIDFSRPVDTAQLKTLLTVRANNNEPVACTFKEGGEGTPKQAIIGIPRSTSFPLYMVVGHGLRWGDAFEFTSGAIQRVFPSEKRVQVKSAVYTRGETARLELYFSVPVQAEPFINLVQAKRFDTDAPLALALESATETDFVFNVIPGANETAPDKINLRIPAGIPSRTGTTLLYPEWTQTLSDAPTGESEEQESSGEIEALDVEDHYWDEEDIDGYALNLSLSHSVTTEDLLNHIKIVPPIENMRVEPGRWEGRMFIKGDWQSEKEYVLTVTGGLESSDKSARLESAEMVALEKTPKMSGAEFDSPELYYYLRKEASAPRVKGRNITEAWVTLARIFPSNIPIFARDFVEYGHRESLMDEYAGELGSLEVAFPDDPDKTHSVPVDMGALMPADKRGVFVMTVGPEYSYSSETSRILIYTDMGALAHWTDSGLVVFVHDLFSLEPVVQAQVTVYSTRFQPMGTIATGPDGIARLGNFDATLGEPALVVLEKGEDYTFLDLREPQEQNTPFTPDMPYFDPEGYDAYIYLDRNLYRPGEPVHIRWITRTRYVDALAGVPLQLRIGTPQGRWIQEVPVTLSEFGTGSFDFQSERVHPTGKYSVELRVPEAEEAIGIAAFNLEEFVPNRLRATAAFSAERLGPGDSVDLLVTAENLFGGVAAGRKTEGRVFLRPMRYESKDWPGYSFGNEDSLEENLIPLGESITDAEGKSTFSYTFEPEEEATMPLEVVASGRVLELGGRAVTDSAQAIAFPDLVLLGMAAAPRPEREILDVHVLALNPDETAAALTSVKVSLERRVWNYYLRRFDNRNDPRWDENFDLVQTFDVALEGGKGTLELPYPAYGEYRLRVHADETRMYSSITFNRWWGRLNVESASRPELIRLAMNQETYRVGDPLELSIESPYDGMAYIVAQGDALKDSIAVPVVNGEGHAAFTVTSAWFPNTWMQVTVVRTAQNKALSNYPYSSFVMANVPLDNPDRRIETTFVNVPETILPAAPLEVVLETRDQAGNPVAAEITVAAVDEGIHSILGYDNPGPYTYFQRSRQMEVRQAHYYDKVFYEPEESAPGGDMMRRLGLTSQVDENWIKPVALWSGIVRSDATGRAVITFNVPEFIGQLRLVAVAVTERAVGGAAVPVLVKRPYILRTSMPRFTLCGDQFDCTAVAINTTDAAVTAAVRWNASGALSGAGEQQLALGPGAEDAVRARVTSAAATGQGMLEWVMTITDASGTVLETITEKAPIPVRAPAAYQTNTEFITLKPGEKRVIENTLFKMDPGLNTAIEVSNDLFLRIRPGLKYLLRYPYGCVEQTVSRAMPLYFLRNYARLYEDLFVGDTEAVRVAENAERYLKQAIARLLSMQTANGGIGFWPGSATSYPYGSVYALHFLTLVRRDHAFEVYDAAFQNLQRHAAEIMKNDLISTASDYYLRAYACYVLALDGNLEAIEYIKRFDTVPVPVSARYLLAAAGAMHTNDPEAALDRLESMPVVQESGRESSGTLHSAVRSEAVRLIALLHLNAPGEKMLPLVNSLVDYLGAVKYTTQETAFAVTALAMYLEKQTADPASASVRIVDADGERMLGPGELFSKNVAGVPPRFEIANEGGAPVYIYVEMAGNPLAPRLTPVEEGIAITREFLNVDGSKIDATVFKHTGQYLVQLTLAPKKAVENLLVTDLLPAGFEVANPRLEADEQPELEQGVAGNLISTPDYLEVRDDRIAIALDRLEPKPVVFRYLVRAVTPGRFQLPALHAECMYTPEITATTVPSEITVE